MIYPVTLNPVLDRTRSVPAIVFDEALEPSGVRVGSRQEADDPGKPVIVEEG